MVRQTDLAEQRPASLDRASVRDVRTEACKLADAATNLLVLDARDGRLGKVIAQLMGHAKFDTRLNVYTQIIDSSLRRAAGTVGSELFTIVHKPEATTPEGSNHKPKSSSRHCWPERVANLSEPVPRRRSDFRSLLTGRPHSTHPSRHSPARSRQIASVLFRSPASHRR